MNYVDVATARAQPGLRLVLTVGGPGPWGEAAKAVFAVKKVPFLPVRQDSGEANDELQAWCGHRNAPVACYDDERPRAGWAEILLLAERLAPEPALLPSDPALRAEALGLAHEICGEQGLGYSRRLMLFQGTLEGRAARGKPPGKMGEMAARYGYEPRAAAAAPGRVAELLGLLATRLREERAKGSRFFVGGQLGAVDLYWATFAAMLAPLPHGLCPMSESLRRMYTCRDETVLAALTPELLAHRDFVYERYLETPLRF